MITKNDFVGFFHIDTSRGSAHLDNCIAQIEDRFLGKVEYDEGNTDEVSDIKKMLVGFTYYYYVQDIDSITSPIGNTSMTPENSEKKMDFSKLVRAYNQGVEVFNSYTSGNAMLYINTFGI